MLDGCVLGFEINFKILECEVFNLCCVLQIDVNLEFELMQIYSLLKDWRRSLVESITAMRERERERS